MHLKLFLIHWKEVVLCSIRLGIFALLQLVFFILTNTTTTTTTSTTTATITTTTTKSTSTLLDDDTLMLFPLMTNLVVISYCWITIGISCLMWFLINKTWCCAFSSCSRNNNIYFYQIKKFLKVYLFLSKYLYTLFFK